MTRGRDLTAAQVANAIDYNTRRFSPAFMRRIQSHLSLPSTRGSGHSGAVSDPFVRDVADWQEAHMGTGSGDGVINPRTEAHMGLVLPEARQAVSAAERMVRHDGIRQVGYLYDGWGNDLRDNDRDGRLDSPGVWRTIGGRRVILGGTPHGNDRSEDVSDSSHYARTYRSFGVVDGGYAGGWPGQFQSLTVPTSTTVRGRFLYRNCADIVSEAFRTAGVMHHLRRTVDIRHVFERNGWVWRRARGYPERYLPGDFIGIVNDSNPNHVHGHAAIVVEEGPTNNGYTAPVVIEMPGPSSSISARDYRPEQRNDLRRHRWPTFRLTVNKEWQFLGRLLQSRLHGHH